jgi:hypothetical protein
MPAAERTQDARRHDVIRTAWRERRRNEGHMEQRGRDTSEGYSGSPAVANTSGVGTLAGGNGITD